MEEIETFNKYGVGMQGGKFGMLMPPRGLMTQDEALLLAAWLVALADPVGDKFHAIFDAVQRT